jgi:hypothetical protein
MPSPKPPPVCRKGPPKPDGPELVPALRILTAQVVGGFDVPGYPKAFNVAFPLDPLPTPYHWWGETFFDFIAIAVGVFKNFDDDRYAVYTSFAVSEVPTFEHEWFQVLPTKDDPLSLPDLYHKYPFSDNSAQVTITS